MGVFYGMENFEYCCMERFKELPASILVELEDTLSKCIDSDFFRDSLLLDDVIYMRDYVCNECVRRVALQVAEEAWRDSL